MTPKDETKVLVLSLLLTAGIICTAFWWFTNDNKKEIVDDFLNFIKYREARISLGSQILVKANTNSDKEAGVQAFAANDYTTAVAKFQSSRDKNKNDPEVLIYLNNAKAAANSDPVKIAVSVPIGGNLNVAKEILRGVAMAQDEVNRSRSINGKLLQVEIANDNNDPEIAKEIAAELVKDSSVSGVIAHNSSNVSIAAAPIYQKGGLVTVSPSSTAKELSGIGSYLFRTVPSSSVEAKTLSDYAIKTARITNIAICADSQNRASQSFKEEFTLAFEADKGKVARTDCDFSDLKVNPSTAVSQAISNGADGLLLVPSVDKINQAVEIAIANKNRLPLFSYSVMYTFKTLQSGQEKVNGMVLTVPWHPAAFPGNPFPSNAFELWGGSVNWRTALAYDAAKAIITGLKQSNTRAGLQQALHNEGFLIDGTTGKFKFLPSGDRATATRRERHGAAILVQVQPGRQSNTGYDFIPF